MFAAPLLLAPQPTSPAKPGQPFGLEMGIPLSRLVVSKREADHAYEIRVPRPSRDFATFIATVTPGEGLCRVQATTPMFSDDSFGTRARSRFHALRAELAASYGANRLFEFVERGASSVKPGDWAETIRRGERSVAAFWDADEKSALPPEIANVRLQIGAADWRSTYLSLIIEFANFSSCFEQAERDRRSSAAPPGEAPVRRRTG